MFNIAFPELIIIAIVALIVIGPEKLPKVARGAGLLLGRMQRFATNIKSEIDNELKSEDLKRLRDELQQQSLGLGEELRQGMQPVELVIKQNIKPEPDSTVDNVELIPKKQTDEMIEAVEQAPLKRSISN